MDSAQSEFVLFCDVRDSDTKPYLDTKLPDVSFACYADKAQDVPEDIAAKTTILSVFIHSKLPIEVLEKMPNLKAIMARSTGFDHIDLAYCAKRNILVSNVPTYGENTVAEHAMTLLLTLTRRIPEATERVKSGSFSPDGLTGMDIKGKTLGVIGTGHIGAYLIRIAKGFGMNVIAFDAFGKPELEKELGFIYVPMETLLAKSDVISLHVPYLESTHHVINREAISKMKQGVIILNTARGGLIETDALFDGLKTGKIGGAGLDVIEEEAFITDELELLYRDETEKTDLKIALENHVMANLPNVVMTPHSAFNSKEALQRILETTVQNIHAYLSGTPQNVVKAS